MHFRKSTKASKSHKMRSTLRRSTLLQQFRLSMNLKHFWLPGNQWTFWVFVKFWMRLANKVATTFSSVTTHHGIYQTIQRTNTWEKALSSSKTSHMHLTSTQSRKCFYKWKPSIVRKDSRWSCSMKNFHLMSWSWKFASKWEWRLFAKTSVLLFSDGSSQLFNKLCSALRISQDRIPQN